MNADLFESDLARERAARGLPEKPPELDERANLLRVYCERHLEVIPFEFGRWLLSAGFADVLSPKAYGALFGAAVNRWRWIVADPAIAYRERAVSPGARGSGLKRFGYRSLIFKGKTP